MVKKPKDKKLRIIIALILSIVVVVSIVVFKKYNEAESDWEVKLSDTGISPDSTSVKNSSENGFTVDYIDVSQGDCALISCNGKNMLIDCAEAEYYEVVKNFLISKNIEHLDIVIASHPHSDHIGGMSLMLEDFSVGMLLMPQIKDSEELNNDTYKIFLKALENHSVNTRYAVNGDEFYLADAKITILGPVKNSDEINNMSLVIMVEYGENKLLFTGDMEKEAEKFLLDAKVNVDCDILKVSHHGSKDSSSIEFIQAASPKIAVISVSRYNEYNHPNGETLKNLLKEDVNVYRTDFDGTVSFYAESPDSEIVCLTK